MELPDSIKTLGEQVEAGSDIKPAAELFEAYPVFAVEVAQLFTRPWLAVDHVSRLAGDGDYFRAEVGSRSIVLVREAPDRIHALRNACLHAATVSARKRAAAATTCSASITAGLTRSTAV
jgi:phenylpropionate dioxygenase-like ring-hydroxylating dioxygenase large terminal subunit